MAEREILEFSNRGGHADPDIWYCEGHSYVVALGDKKRLGINYESVGWFCFEERFVKCVVELFNLGFDMREIYDAWSKGVDSTVTDLASHEAITEGRAEDR